MTPSLIVQVVVGVGLPSPRHKKLTTSPLFVLNVSIPGLVITAGSEIEKKRISSFPNYVWNIPFIRSVCKKSALKGHVVGGYVFSHLKIEILVGILGIYKRRLKELEKISRTFRPYHVRLFQNGFLSLGEINNESLFNTPA